MSANELLTQAVPRASRPCNNREAHNEVCVGGGWGGMEGLIKESGNV